MRWYRVGAAALTAVVGLAAAVTLGPLAVVTTNGTSMQPRIVSGDLVVVGPSSSYEVGDSVAYRSPMLDSVVLHRIIAVEGDRYVLKGDNNAWPDPETPTRDGMVGEELLHIPQGGIWLKRLTTPPALAAYTFLLLAGGAATARTTRQRRKEHRIVSPRHRTRAASTFGSVPPALRPLAAAAAALGLLGVAVGGMSWTRPTATTGSAPTSGDSTLDLAYAATVPASAAYDSTTVVAPQPVFRRLTDVVDITYDYSGRPGTIAVDARLASASGWTSTLHLTSTATLKSEQTGRVRLDLAALEDRAEAAAAVTGLPAGALTITVIPRISMDGGGQMAPELSLTLDELVLKPASEQGPTGTASSAARDSTDGKAQLSAFGRSIDVQSARTASLGALLLASLVGVALLVLCRLHGPVSATDQIHARHKSLLLPVLPIVLPPGRPVVDVPDIDALATLAQRYGLLVLHWQRGGVHTYVVQDEGTSYRFRRSDAAAQDAPEGASAAQHARGPVALEKQH